MSRRPEQKAAAEGGQVDEPLVGVRGKKREEEDMEGKNNTGEGGGAGGAGGGVLPVAPGPSPMVGSMKYKSEMQRMNQRQRCL